MDSHEYERRKRHLEEQRRADLELIEEGYRAKLRALEAVWLGATGAAAPAPPPAVTSPPPAPVAPVQPAAPARRPRQGDNEVYFAVLGVLEQMGEEFDKRDLVRAIGFEPTRNTLHRTLRELEREGHIVQTALGMGPNPARYRKGSPASP